MSNYKPATLLRVCPVCGGPVPVQPGAGRPSRYCSSRCKSRAARQRRIERELASGPDADGPTSHVIADDVRQARRLSRQAAIDLVADDPDALNIVLTRATTMISSPAQRESRWREVAATISALAALIPEE